VNSVAGADAPTLWRPAICGCPYDLRVPDDARDKRLCRVFGKRLRELRRERDLTQSEVAEHAGTSITYVSQIERGLRNPTLAIVVRLAAALDITPEELVAGLGRVV
jgi:DNA-binding XRE family transcriptional regulator